METIKKYNTGYTQVLNEMLYDKNLSLKAKGIYAYLFSKPDGWQFHIAVMEQELKESRGQIYSAIKELIDFNYITRYQSNEKGVFGGMVYEFIDIKNRNTDIPCTEKTAYGKNGILNNTDILNNTNNINNTDIIKEEKNKKEESIDFGELKEPMEKWLAYKKEKGQAYKSIGLKTCFEKLKRFSGGSVELANEIIENAIANNYTGFFELKKQSSRGCSGFCNDEGIPY